MIKRYDEFLNEGFKYEYGCVMVKFDVPNWKDILNEIKKEDLYTDEKGYGLETEPHVTLLYGIHSSVLTSDVKKVVEYAYQPYVTFKNISIFNNPLSKYDVLKFEAESENLIHMYEMLSSQLPNINAQPTYNPHMTIAYLKSGRGISYIKTLDKAIILKPTKIIYSEPTGNGKKSVVDLLVWPKADE